MVSGFNNSRVKAKDVVSWQVWSGYYESHRTGRDYVLQLNQMHIQYMSSFIAKLEYKAHEEPALYQ